MTVSQDPFSERAHKVCWGGCKEPSRSSRVQMNRDGKVLLGGIIVARVVLNEGRDPIDKQLFERAFGVQAGYLRGNDSNATKMRADNAIPTHLYRFHQRDPSICDNNPGPHRSNPSS